MENKEKDIVSSVSLPHPNKLLVIEALDYSNPYDYHRLHRHDYFEIILVNSGVGSQLIDFSNYTIAASQIFTVYPGQVHLMNRDTANGLLIQFRKDLFELIHPLRHYHLYFCNPVFNFDYQSFQHVYDLAERMELLLNVDAVSPISNRKIFNYLQIILITLIESREKEINFQQRDIVTQFLSLLTEHIYDVKKVSDYCQIIGCTTDKLNAVCKVVLGKNALQLIHEEMLLEIRRLLLLGNYSLKEIAYQLNFDSQANFSGFVKGRTGLTPSDLQTQVRQIYN